MRNGFVRFAQHVGLSPGLRRGDGVWYLAKLTSAESRLAHHAGDSISVMPAKAGIQWSNLENPFVRFAQHVALGPGLRRGDVVWHFAKVACVSRNALH